MIHKINPKTFHSNFHVFYKLDDKQLAMAVLSLMITQIGDELSLDDNTELMMMGEYKMPNNSDILYTLKDIGVDCERKDLWKNEADVLTLQEKQNLRFRFNKPSRWFNVKRYNQFFSYLYSYYFEKFDKFFNGQLDLNLTDLRNDGVLCFWEHYYVILQSIPLTGQIIDDEYRKLLKI